MKRIFTCIVLIAGLALTSCNPEVKPFDPSQNDLDLKGIWQTATIRFEGGVLPGTDPFFAIIEPNSCDIVLVTKADEVGGAMTDNMKLEALDGEIKILDAENFATKGRAKESYVSKFPYTVLEDGDCLHIYPQAVDYLVEDGGSRDMNGKSFHIELYREKELEAKVAEGTKAAGSPSWLASATAVVIDKLSEDGSATYKIDEYLDFVKTPTWRNTGGWSRPTWMSCLPDDRPVAWVNLPGSHDSATARFMMGVEAATTDACVQTYSVRDQYTLGARFFDFRVGSSLKWDVWPISKRKMTQAEMDKVEDLEMFHGPLETDTYFLASLRELANEMRKTKSEFIVINLQAERESSGLYDWAASWLDDSVLGTKKQSQMFDMVVDQAMNIANRLLKEFNAENNDILIPYRPDLTVGEARGHIIVMEDKKNMVYQCRSYAMTLDGKIIDKDWLRASFYTGWPNNNKGYATLFTYSQADSLKNDLYVQSFYEMKVSDKAKIEKKEAAILELVEKISAENLDKDKKNVLGFNAMNANTGSGILKTYVFAHEFNGYAYEMYVGKMKAGEGPLRCGIVSMDHYGAQNYEMTFSSDVRVYGDLLSWAVIESNFYEAE